MPNNDLGTAHGRIRIDFEDKGTAAALAALQRMQKQFTLLNTRVGKIEKTLNQETESLKKNTDAVKKAKKETDSWLFTLMGGERIVKAFDKDIVDLTQDITKLYTQYSQARQKFKPFETTFKILDRYQRFRLDIPLDRFAQGLSKLRFNNLAQGEHRVRALGKAFDSVGLGTAAALTLVKQFSYGYTGAMRALPNWTRQLHQFSISLAGVGAAGLMAGKALNMGFITKFLNTNVFRNIILQANNAGNAFEKLGALSTKVFGRNIFGKLELNLKNSESIITRWTKNTSHSLSAASRGFNTWFQPVAAAAKQIQTFTLGIGLMAAGISDIAGRFAFLGRIPKPLLVALATTLSVVLPAALQLFDKGLIGTSNILAGLLVGVKQLSGGLLAIPGAFAAIGAATATLRTVFGGGVTDLFKALVSPDAEKAINALAEMPPHLSAISKAVLDANKKFREMQVGLQKLAFKDVEKQIASLAEKYIPILNTGMSQVTFAMRGAKDEFVKFLEQGQTQRDTNTIFAKTAEIILNIKNALRPAADGLRDIATVGTQFFAEWSAGLGSLTERFAAWARANRESGQLLTWMREAKEGTRDLINGTKDLGKGLWNVLTMFRSNVGANWLDRYAATMDKFNEGVKKSRQSGVLFDFTSSVKGLGESREKIDAFKTVWQNFVDMMKSVAPAIQNVSNVFTSLFIPNLILAMDSLKYFAKVMSALNLDNFTGLILGLIAGFKLFPTFVKPAWDALRVFLGLIFTLKSASGVTKAIGDGVGILAKALETIPGIGSKAATSITNFHKSMSGAIGVIARIAGPVAIAATALGFLWTVMRAGRQNAEDFDKQLKTNVENVKKFGKELTVAFYADKGKLGATVMDQVSLGMETMLRDLETTASKAPGMVDHVADLFRNSQERAGSIPVEIPIIGTIAAMVGGDSAEIDRRQAEGDAAKLAAQKYKELTKQNVDLSMVMSGTQAAFDARVGNLRTQGQAGKALADVLVRQRNEFNQVKAAMDALGPSGIQLANGLKEISDAGGDATSKLNGLRNVLTGLGFLKVDQLEAAAEYTRTLGDLGDQIAQLKADGADFSNIWNVDGTINDANESAAKLIPVLNQVSTAYMNAAAGGKDVDEINARLNQTLDEVAPALGRSAEQLKEFFKTNMGTAPMAVKLALSLDGVQDQVAKGIGNLMLQLQAQEAGVLKVPITLDFGSDEAAHTFDETLEKRLGKDLFDQDGHIIKIKTGVQIDEASIQGLLKYLQEQGIPIPAGTVVDPAKIPVVTEPAPAPVAPPTILTPERVREQAPPIGPFLGPPQVYSPSPLPWEQRGPHPWELPPAPAQATQPQVPTIAPPSVPDLAPKLDEASAKVDEIDGKMQNLVSQDRKIELNVDKVNEAGTKIDELEQKFARKNLKAEVEVNGIEKLDAANTSAEKIVQTFTSTFSTFTEQIQKSFGETTGKITELSNQVLETLSNLATEAINSGSKFVDAFAQGLANNPAAVTAARTMADNVLKQFHQSPPKEGPLAEHGDAAKYGGTMFVESYARGLRTAAPTAGDAAGTVAGAAVSGMQGGGRGGGAPGAKAGQFLGQILEMTSFFSSIMDVVGKVTESVFKLAKYISDPMGKGTFFGGSLGFKKLSEAELRRRREDREQQDARSMMESPTRNTEDYDRRLEVITNAQNAVVQDSGGIESQEAPKTVGALIKEAFPEIASIGGARPDPLPYHSEGRALDIMIPEYNTPEGKALGDRINAWALANAEQIGLVDTIWQDFWQPADGSRGNFMGRQGDTQGHYDHVHLTFATGANVDLSGIEMNPEELANYERTANQSKKESALQRLQAQYGPPLLDGETMPTEPTTMRYNSETGNYEVQTPHGKSELPGPGRINPETQMPYTPEESLLYEQRNPLEYTLPEGLTADRLNEMVQDPNFVVESQQQTLERVTGANANMADALRMAENPDDFSDSALINTLTAIDNEIFRLNETDTPANRTIASDLQTVKSSIMDRGGFEQNANPIDTVAGIAGQAVGIASDIIGTVTTGIESIGAAQDITSTLVRGISGTEGIGRIVDNVQKFIELGAKVSGSVASVTGLAGSVAGAAAAGGGDMGATSAALGAVSTIASLVQAGYETANAIIDLSQEAMRIVGSYVGDFLGYLTGGEGGPLAGNVKFLLDQQTNQLMAYSADNPLDKRTHDIPFTNQDESSRQQMIGNINVYGGPGSDPRDLTRQMMYQVNSAQYAGALGY